MILYATYPTATFYTLFGLPEVKICKSQSSLSSDKAAEASRGRRARRPLLPDSFQLSPRRTDTFYAALTDIGSFLATLNARSPHASGAFDESVSRTSRGGGKGGFGGLSAQQPVHVTVRQEVNIDAEDDDISLGSRKDALGLGEGSTRGSFPATAHYATAATPYRVQFDRTAGGDAEVDKGRPLHVPHNAF